MRAPLVAWLLCLGAACASGAARDPVPGQEPPAPSAVRASVDPARSTGTDWGVLMIRSALGRVGPKLRLPRLAAAGVDVRFLDARGRSGRDGAPVEMPFDFEHLGNLASIDFGGAVTRELQCWRQATGSEVLHVFVTDDPQGTRARQVSDPARELRLPTPLKTVRVTGLDGSNYGLEPGISCLFFPGSLATVAPEQLTSSFRHELAHALHLARNPIMHEGYRTTFGGHDVELRTSARTAYVEGFAEFVETRFAESWRDRDPRRFASVWRRKNPQAYCGMLVVWWLRFVRDAGLTQRLGEEQIETAWRQIQGDGTLRHLPALSDYLERVTNALTGKGTPPFQRAELAQTVARFCDSHAEAMQNLIEEGRRALESREPARVAGQSASVTATASGGNDGAIPHLPPLSAARPASDLLRTEGAVAAIFLALDRLLVREGLDFLALALRASNQAVPGNSGWPPWPVTARELLVVMNRLPELKNRLLPMVDRVTRGLVREQDLALEASPGLGQDGRQTGDGSRLQAPATVRHGPSSRPVASP